MPEEFDEYERSLARQIQAYLSRGVHGSDPRGALRIPDEIATHRRHPNPAGLVAATALLVVALAAGQMFRFGGAPSESPPNTDEPVASVSLQTSLTERERSDRFWAGVSTFAPTNYRYDNLAEMVADAHLVVVGRVVGFQAGAIEPFDQVGSDGPGARPVTFGIVAIDRVIKGQPATTSPGSILVARLGTEVPQADLPAGNVVLFLKNYALMRVEEGAPTSGDPSDKYYYVRPNGYQCVLRDIDGMVEIIDGPEGWEEALGPFPRDLDGQTFDETLGQIESLARAAARVGPGVSHPAGNGRRVAAQV